MQFFNHPEGYVTPNNANGFDYVYQYTDHLGNIRLSYADSDGNGTVSQSEIIEEKNYYPFGLTHKGYNDVTQPTGNSVANRYGYNGKELQDEIVGGSSLDWYDYGARNYDPALGRWMSPDPLAEDYYYDSPYVYTTNNPVLYLDPDGRFWIDNKDGTYTAEAGDSASTLAEDANISFEKAKEIMANTKKDNSLGNMGTYIDPKDGVEKSAVDEGDVVRVVGKEVGDLVIVPNDSDIATSDISNSGVDEFETKVENPEQIKGVAELASAIVGSANPRSKIIKSGIAAKGVSQTSKLKTANSIKNARGSTGTTSQVPTSKPSSKSVSPSQRKVIRKKARKTLKNRKKQ